MTHWLKIRPGGWHLQSYHCARSSIGLAVNNLTPGKPAGRPLQTARFECRDRRPFEFRPPFTKRSKIEHHNDYRKVLIGQWRTRKMNLFKHLAGLA
jgi:hypothetical protein